MGHSDQADDGREVATREGGVDRNFSKQYKENTREVATREGGVDRNKFNHAVDRSAATSPPARVAWIETCNIWAPKWTRQVATREGGVDRNIEALKNISGAECRHPRGWRG